MSLIQLRGVTHFYGRVCALRNVTLQVESGAIGRRARPCASRAK